MAPAPFQVCLVSTGGSTPSLRRIVDVAEDDTLQDLYRVASEVFGTPQSAARIQVLKYGFPPKALEQSSSILVRSALQHKDRVMAIIPKEENSAVNPKKRPASAASNAADAATKIRRVGGGDNAKAGATLSKKKNLTTPLTVLSWNIAECKPSNDAPSRDKFDTEAAIVRELVKHEAHVLCLQECPAADWKPIELLEKCYKLVGSERSHCGYTQLWIRQQPKKDAFLFQRVPLPSSAPSVAAIILIGENQPIIVSSSHLAPFKENAPARLQQIEALTKTVSCLTSHAIHSGDFNMRKAEDKKMEHGGNGRGKEQQQLYDAWKIAGSSKKEEYTWNSITNTYHANGFGFKCRFDRIYFSSTLFGDAIDFRVVANRPCGTSGNQQAKSFYPSDHFGLLCTVKVPHDENNHD